MVAVGAGMRAAGAVVALGLMMAPGAALACRLALVLAMDVSASVNDVDYRLQAEGTAAALQSPSVSGALLDPSRPPVAIAVFVWSGPRDQDLVADWTLIDSPDVLAALADRIRAHPRKVAVSGRTAMGDALLWGGALLARAPTCDRQVVDLSTDGTYNAGTPPEAVRSSPAFGDITINALAVAGGQVPDWRDGGTRETALAAYLTRLVIRGPGAFVEIARDYSDFERAMTRKLNRELAGMVIGQLP